jgi:hypothetical protein
MTERGTCTCSIISRASRISPLGIGCWGLAAYASKAWQWDQQEGHQLQDLCQIQVWLIMEMEWESQQQSRREPH